MLSRFFHTIESFLPARAERAHYLGPQWDNMPPEDQRFLMEVRINVYSVSASSYLRWYNTAARQFGTGAYHTSVEIHGLEWSFSGGLSTGSGIQCSQPGLDPNHQFVESIRAGYVWTSENDVHALMEELAPLWPESSYDLLARNCNHFTESVLRKLNLDGLPSWITRLSDAAREVRSAVAALKEFCGKVEHAHCAPIRRTSEAAEERSGGCLVEAEELEQKGGTVLLGRESMTNFKDPATSSLPEIPTGLGPIHHPNGGTLVQSSDPTGEAIPEATPTKTTTKPLTKAKRTTWPMWLVSVVGSSLGYCLTGRLASWNSSEL